MRKRLTGEAKRRSGRLQSKTEEHAREPGVIFLAKRRKRNARRGVGGRGRFQGTKRREIDPTAWPVRAGGLRGGRFLHDSGKTGEAHGLSEAGQFFRLKAECSMRSGLRKGVKRLLFFLWGHLLLVKKGVRYDRTPHRTTDRTAYSRFWRQFKFV